MARFDVFENPDSVSSGNVPYLLDVQSDFLESIPTRVVVPLVSREAFGEVALRLNPVFQVDGRTVVMSTPEMAGIAKGDIGRRVMSLEDARDEIIGALDFLIVGF